MVLGHQGTSKHNAPFCHIDLDDPLGNDERFPAKFIGPQKKTTKKKDIFYRVFSNGNVI